MYQVKNSLNADSFPRDIWEGSSKSMAVPDQALTVRQIMDRFNKGLPLGGGNRNPVFDGEDEYVPDFAAMDEIELAEWKEKYQDELVDISKRSRKKKEVKNVTAEGEVAGSGAEKPE